MSGSGQLGEPALEAAGDHEGSKCFREVAVLIVCSRLAEYYGFAAPTCQKRTL